MTCIKIKYKKLGGHYHCRVFTGKGVGFTYAKCGDLVFSEEEFPDIRTAMSHVSFEEEK